MTTYPVRPVVRPTDLIGVDNGKLPDSLLAPLGLSAHRLHRHAARAWKALRSAARDAGYVLSLTDSYRTYDQQVALKKAKGSWAATPGNSNHGLGLAVDFAEDADGDDAYEWPPKSASPGLMSWMLANAGRFGWSWERQDESWHIRYVAGDLVPQAVLDFERPPAPIPQPPDPQEDDDMPPQLIRFRGYANELLFAYNTFTHGTEEQIAEWRTKYGDKGKAFVWEPHTQAMEGAFAKAGLNVFTHAVRTPTGE